MFTRNPRLSARSHKLLMRAVDIETARYLMFKNPKNDLENNLDHMTVMSWLDNQLKYKIDNTLMLLVTPAILATAITIHGFNDYGVAFSICTVNILFVLLMYFKTRVPRNVNKKIKKYLYVSDSYMESLDILLTYDNLEDIIELTNALNFYRQEYITLKIEVSPDTTSKFSFLENGILNDIVGTKFAIDFINKTNELKNIHIGIDLNYDDFVTKLSELIEDIDKVFEEFKSNVEEFEGYNDKPSILTPHM